MKKIILFVVAAVLLINGLVSASEFIFERSTIIYVNETIDDDVYIFSNSGEIEGAINGDLVGFCYKLTSYGQISGSYNLLAYSAVLDGTVGNSARLFGKYIDVRGHIKNNLVAYGGDITVEKSAVVGKDINVSGELVVIDGEVAGDVKVSADIVEIDGHIIGDISIIAREISINSGAIIEGEMYYRSQTEAYIDDEAKILGDTYWDESGSDGKFEKTTGSFLAILKAVLFLMALMMGFFLIIFFKNHTREASIQIETRTGKSLGIGVVAFLIFTIGALVLLVFIFTAPISIFLISLGLFLFYIGKVYVAMVCGRLILRLFSRDKFALGWEFILGLIVLTILFRIPGLGIVVYILTCLIGIGGAILGYIAMNQRYNQLVNKPAEIGTPPA